MRKTINTNERIFQVMNFDGDVNLGNLRDFSISSTGELLFNSESIKNIKHYWNNKFVAFRKADVKTMYVGNLTWAV